jgi:adenosylhomocysteine nucleosidase
VVLEGSGRRWTTLEPHGYSTPVRLLSIDRVAVRASEKKQLALESGADVIEMEAAGVAAVAASNDLAFYCLRVVSDDASEDLPLDFNRYRDREGRFAKGRIAAACALRPWLVPRLMRFDRQCRHSAESLGECLVNARFAE